jgi:hypothetical protein
MDEKETKMEDDKSQSLMAIRVKAGTSTSSMILEVQKHQKPHSLEIKSPDWIRNLECLYKIDCDRPTTRRKRLAGGGSSVMTEEMKQWGRHNISPKENYHERNFVVLSYPWNPSAGEDGKPGPHYVQKRDSGGFIQSVLRNVVWEMASAYMEYCKSGLLWVDQECINQYDEVEKEVAVQNMDLVYSLSTYPVALLHVSIKSKEHLDLLVKLLSGQIFQTDKQTGLSDEIASQVIEVLKLITSDTWWTRAWTFHEDYMASTRMVLLISHHRSLDRQKRRAVRYIGNLEGELCIKSTKFREAATKFCQAYLRKRNLAQSSKDTCEKVLLAAAKYTISLRELDKKEDKKVCKPMSPAIFEDLGSRGIKNPSDFLAIIANCCEYKTRLDTKALSDMKSSLSMSMLTLGLLNGQILRNNQGDKNVLSVNIFGFLKEQSLEYFNPPVSNELTFLKSCRFPSVKISKEGIKTTGHLWKLGMVVDSEDFSEPPFEEISSTGMKLPCRRVLRLLANELKSGTGKHGYRYRSLAESIETFLDEDRSSSSSMFSPQTSHSGSSSSSLEDLNSAKINIFNKQYQDIMAEELVRAINDKKKLRLARLVNYKWLRKPKTTSPYSPYLGVFICDTPETELGKDCYVFTSSSLAGGLSDDVYKFVSLEVDCDRFTSNGVPRLLTKMWVNGLCFPDKAQRNVVFPWPVAFTK